MTSTSSRPLRSHSASWTSPRAGAASTCRPTSWPGPKPSTKSASGPLPAVSAVSRANPTHLDDASFNILENNEWISGGSNGNATKSERFVHIDGHWKVKASRLSWFVEIKKSKKRKIKEEKKRKNKREKGVLHVHSIVSVDCASFLLVESSVISKRDFLFFFPIDNWRLEQIFCLCFISFFFKAPINSTSTKTNQQIKLINQACQCNVPTEQKPIKWLDSNETSERVGSYLSINYRFHLIPRWMICVPTHNPVDSPTTSTTSWQSNCLSSEQSYPTQFRFNPSNWKCFFSSSL